MNNNKILKEEYIVLNSIANSQLDAFNEISQLAYQKNLITDVKEVVNAFVAREKISTTGFEKGIAIPHAQSEFIKQPAVFVWKFNNPIEWKSVDKSKTKVAIAIILPKDKIADFQIDILKQISLKLLDSSFVEKIKSNDCSKEWIVKNLLFKDVNAKMNIDAEKKITKTLVAVTGCASGVAHTYMCKELLEKVGPELGYKVRVECQGQRGKEFDLSQEEIDNADLIIFALDIGIDESMYYDKIVYRVGTHSVVSNAKKVILDAENFKKAELWKKANKKKHKSRKSQREALAAQPDFIQAAGKGKPQVLKHLLSGCSYLIPFVIFSGISFSIIIGITKGIGGATFAFKGTWADTLKEITKLQLGAYTHTLKILFLLNSLVTLGFTFMIPIMGAYIAFSICGRAGLVSGFIATWVLCHPGLWFDYNGIFNLTITSAKKGAVGAPAGASWSLFGAIYAGFVGGYITKYMLKIRVPKWFAPPMAMIVIPVSTTLLTIIPAAFLLAAPFGWIMCRIDHGITYLGTHPSVGWVAGVVCGLMIGFDLGGPVNKIAVLVATSLIPTVEHGQLMGACGAAIPIAPLGSGLASCIFARKLFNKNERAAGWNALLIGSMGITESAIPFFARDTWRSLIPNMIGSAVAGAIAYVAAVSDHVGAWGSFIVAAFGGVQSTANDSYFGVVWYCLAIVVGAFVQCAIYTSLLLQKDHLFKKHALIWRDKTIYAFNKVKTTTKKLFKK